MVDAKVFSRPPFLIKVLELALGAVCMGLIAGNPGVTYGDYAKLEIVHATYYGFFIVISVVVLSYILDAPIHGKLMMVIALCGAVLYFTAGALNLEAYDKGGKWDKLLAVGIVGLLNGLLHAADVYLSWRG